MNAELRWKSYRCGTFGRDTVWRLMVGVIQVATVIYDHEEEAWLVGYYASGDIRASTLDEAKCEAELLAGVRRDVD